MVRIRRGGGQVSVSRNHCNYPLVFPPTKKLGDHAISSKMSAYGIGEYDEDGKLAYVLATSPCMSYEGENLGCLTKFDGQVIFGLLNHFQAKIRTLKKRKEFEDRDEDYHVRFQSVYEMLVFLKMPTNNTGYYDRLIKSLYRIDSTKIIFCKEWRNPKTGKFETGIKQLPLFYFLDVHSTRDDEKICYIDIELGKEWYKMNESYFVPTDLILFKELSEIELNLRNILEPWWEEMSRNGYIITRDLGRLCLKIGYNEQPLPRLRSRLKHAIAVINDKCDRDYSLSFNRHNVTIFSGTGAEMKKIMGR